MADINLTGGDDLYVHPAERKEEWNNYFAQAGNDTLRLYQGTGIGGPGNDRIERIADTTNPNRELGAAYWDSPAGIVANLAAGWIDDGWGTRDTVAGVSKVHGSGRNDQFIGDTSDNFFHPNGGRDTLDGGGGIDGFDVREIPPNVDGSGTWRPAVMADLDIRVAADGLSATVAVRHYPQITYSTTNMEYLSLIDDPNRYWLADLITQQTMAEQTIAAGGILRWNAAGALGSAVQLSFSFVEQAPASGVGASGFRAFTVGERQAVRDILAQAAAVAGITFSEVTETGGTTGQLRLGVSQQAATKGVSWLPGQNGELAGDVWMDVESMTQLSPGTEGWQALLHEIGHALGLRHPRNVDAGDAWPVQLISSADKVALTVMSQAASVDGLFRAEWGPLDVLALRHLYGTRALNSGDTVYALVPADGMRERTITDDGGIDTLDASALVTGVRLNLAAGALSDVGLSGDGLAGVENLALLGTTLIEHAVGTAADDVLLGNALDNRLTGGAGNDWLDGGAGTDTAVYAGARSAYEISNAFGTTYVRARDGTSGYDTLLAIERLQFSDGAVTLAAAPLSADASASVDEDSALAGTLPTPSDVADRSTVTFALALGAAHGQVSITAGGNYSYTPAANYWGGDSFGWRIVTAAGSNEYRLYLSVLPVNDGAPQGRDATVIIPPDAAYSAAVPAASDIDGDSLSYALTSEPAFGSLQFSTNGTYTYTPRPGRFGDDSFVYSVSDGMGGSASCTLTLRVGLVTPEDTLLAATLPDPVGAPRNAATYTLATPASHGTLTISPQGALQYTPAANYHGEDAFAYDVTVAGTPARLQVALRIDSVNDGPPVAANAAFTLQEDLPLSTALPVASDPDGGSVRYELLTAPTIGQASVTANGQLQYTPNADAHGNDSLSYGVVDAEGQANTYTVQLTIQPVNDAPTAAPAAVATAEDQELAGQLPAAADIDGDAVGYSLLTAAAHGTVSVESDGRYRYVPAAQFHGSDSFEFGISDGHGGSNRYAVALTVTSVNDPPTGGVTITGTPRVAQTLTLLQTLADAEGLGPLAISWLRDGVVIAGASAATLVLSTADIGRAISVRVNYTDGEGRAESVSSTSTSAVAGFASVNGSAADDRLSGSALPDSISGLAGHDTLDGAADADSLLGGDGNDVLIGGSGSDTLDGGAGFDAARYTGDVPVSANLASGLVLQDDDRDLLVSIEAVFGSSAADVLRGAEGSASARGETLRGAAGNDQLDGGSGVDSAEFIGARAGYLVTRDTSASIRLTVRDTDAGNGDEGLDTLDNIERLVFADRLLAFGPRAEEVARVAFVLWTPAIVDSSMLFARGLSYYDVGYSFEEMCRAALQFHSEQGVAFALKLLDNMGNPAGRNVADLQLIMNAAGGGEAGRAAAVASMARDPATTAALQASGVLTQGVVADLTVPGFGTLFALLPGG